MREVAVKLTDREIQGRFNWEEFLEKHKIPVVIGLVGLILIGLGVLGVFKVGQTEDKIEIISSEERTKTPEKILVDIEGAVQKPGVYELPLGSRLQDLLVAAGGLSAEADRVWVEKNLNRAQKIKDGDKFYIPKSGEGNIGNMGSPAVMAATGININTASKSELETLWGVGPATAQKIIDNRPYQDVDDLLKRKILNANVFRKIVSQLRVY